MICEAQDYDEKTRQRSPSVDKVTETRVLQVRVVDMDPELEGRPARWRSRSWPPGAGEGCGLMPARRVTAVTLPVDARSAVAFEAYPGRTR